MHEISIFDVVLRGPIWSYIPNYLSPSDVVLCEGILFM
jgi:hypothetical protein